MSSDVSRRADEMAALLREGNLAGGVVGNVAANDPVGAEASPILGHRRSGRSAALLEGDAARRRAMRDRHLRECARRRW